MASFSHFLILDGRVRKWSQLRVYKCASLFHYHINMESTHFESNPDNSKEKIESLYENSHILSQNGEPEQPSS